MLADHVRVNGMWIDLDNVAHDLFQTRRIKHGACPHHASGRQVCDVGHDLRQNVNRIGHHHDGAATSPESLSDISDNRCVLPQQVETRFAWTTAATRRDDHRVGIRHLLNRAVRTMAGG